MASRQSRLEAEKLAIIQQSMKRGRSSSPNGGGNGGSHSRSSSVNRDDYNKELKWSITNHDPSERIVLNKEQQEKNDFWENEVSEEEHISDDDTNEKFQYDDTGNILPNYACQDEKINEISQILENSNLNDHATIQKLEELTANERALAAAKKAGSKIDQDVLDKLANDKRLLVGSHDLNLNESDQDALVRKQKLENYQAYRKKIIDHENGIRNGSASPTRAPASATPTIN
ncbi:hypothetical protein G210_2724, partial [Candida maltosa Xu316]